MSKENQNVAQIEELVMKILMSLPSIWLMRWEFNLDHGKAFRHKIRHVTD
jgi:hypothetical protein